MKKEYSLLIEPCSYSSSAFTVWLKLNLHWKEDMIENMVGDYSEVNKLLIRGNRLMKDKSKYMLTSTSENLFRFNPFRSSVSEEDFIDFITSSDCKTTTNYLHCYLSFSDYSERESLGKKVKADNGGFKSLQELINNKPECLNISSLRITGPKHRFKTISYYNGVKRSPTTIKINIDLIDMINRNSNLSNSIKSSFIKFIKLNEDPSLYRYKELENPLYEKIL